MRLKPATQRRLNLLAWAPSVLFMKTTALPLVAVALFAVPAFADHEAYPANQYNQQYQAGQYHQAQPPAGNPDDTCDHDRQHPGYAHVAWTQHRRGHYELRNVQTWQEGYTTQVFVPGACFGHVVKVCQPGYYRTEQVPGRYVTTQQYVWVEDHRRSHRGWGRFSRRY
jgi:hypothetical protein